MKRIGKLLCLSVGVIILLLIGDVLNAEVVQKYSDMKDRFSIEVPQGWQIEEREDEANPFIAFRPREKKDEIVFQRVDIVVEEIPDLSLDSFYQDHIKRLDNLLECFALVGEGETRIGNLPARWLLYTDTEKFITLKVKARVKQYIVVEGDRAYLINCRATADTYADYEDIFNKIVNSFQISSK